MSTTVRFKSQITLTEIKKLFKDGPFTLDYTKNMLTVITQNRSKNPVFRGVEAMTLFLVISSGAVMELLVVVTGTMIML